MKKPVFAVVIFFIVCGLYSQERELWRRGVKEFYFSDIKPFVEKVLADNGKNNEGFCTKFVRRTAAEPYMSLMVQADGDKLFVIAMPRLSVLINISTKQYGRNGIKPGYESMAVFIERWYQAGFREPLRSYCKQRR